MGPSIAIDDLVRVQPKFEYEHFTFTTLVMDTY